MAERFDMPFETAFDVDGVTYPGALLNFYEVSTVIRKATFSDSALTTPNANPVEADSAGRFGDIFMSLGSYKVVLTDKDGNDSQTFEPLDYFGSSPVVQTPTGSFWANDSPAAVINRMNDRTLIGPDLEDYDGIQPPVSKTWLGQTAGVNNQPGLAWIERNSQFASFTGYGRLAGSFASHNLNATGNGASIALTAIAVSDDTVQTSGQWAVYVDAKRADGASGVTGMELEITNMGPAISRLSAYNSVAGATIGVMLGAGGDPAVNGDTSLLPVSAGLRFIPNGGMFGVGIVFNASSIFSEDDHAVAPGVYKRAIEMPTSHQIQWVIDDVGNEDPPFAWVKGEIIGTTIADHAIGILIGNGRFSIVNDAQLIQFRVSQGTLTENYIHLIASAIGNGPIIAPDGPTDANIDVKIVPKGTGLLLVQSDLSLTGTVLKVSGSQVVTAQQMGWSATTGTVIRTDFGDASLSETSQALRALITDLKTHGLINTA